MVGSYLRHLTADDGLSQSSVYAILQDTCGFVWFGTKDGLDRYDGYNFKVFVHDPFDSVSLPDNFVTALFQDKKGRIWVGTQYGSLDVYDPRFENFHRVWIGDSIKGPFSDAAIAEDNEGNLWFGTSGDGLVEISFADNHGSAKSAQGDIPFKYYVSKWDTSNTKAFPNNVVSALLCDRSGTLWAGVGGELLSFDPCSNKREVKEYNFLPPPDKINAEILSLYQDSMGDIWAGTNAGLYKLDKRRNLFVSYFEDSRSNHQQLGGIRTICEDTRGRLWLGTFSSIFLLDLKDNQHQLLLNQQSGAICIKRDKSGAIWIGTGGYGLYVYTPNVIHFESFTEKSGVGWPNESVRSILVDSEGRLWIASYGGFYMMNRGRKTFGIIHTKMSDPVRSILQDRDGKLWFASDLGIACMNIRNNSIRYFSHHPEDPASLSSSIVAGLFQDSHGAMWAVTPGCIDKLNIKSGTWSHFYFDRNPGPQNDPPPTSMCQTSDGSIWITSRTGLWRFNPETKSFTHYVEGSDEKKGLSSNITLSLCHDPFQHVIWIGTEGGGLDRLDIHTGEVTTFTEADGLPDNVVYGILRDEGGTLWLSTNKGLAEFDPRTKSIATYKQADGLQGNEYNTGAYFKSPSGELFFGGINGFDAFQPDESQHENYDPNIVITGIDLFGKPLAARDKSGVLSESLQNTKSITLDYKQNVLSLTFASLDFNDPRKNKYEYRLIGFDRDFIPANTSRTVTYTNLDPGKYTFVVRGTNSSGMWSSREANLQILVLPPFWMTWWFRAIVIAAFVSIGPAIYFRRISAYNKEKRQREMFSRRLIESQENERKRIAAEIHDSLGQNLLVVKNRALLALEKPELAEDIRDHLAEISDTVSSTLKEMREISRNLRPYELDRFGITEALKSVVERVGDSSGVSFTMDIDNIDSVLTKEAEINIYRIVQESLNNIVKHSKASGAQVTVARFNNRLQIVVRDNGIGFYSSSSDGDKDGNSGLGLDSISERVRIINGTYEIESLPGSGTTISINVPLHDA